MSAPPIPDARRAKRPFTEPSRADLQAWARLIAEAAAAAAAPERTMGDLQRATLKAGKALIPCAPADASNAFVAFQRRCLGFLAANGPERVALAAELGADAEARRTQLAAIAAPPPPEPQRRLPYAED
jgi:hypothetical protein